MPTKINVIKIFFNYTSPLISHKVVGPDSLQLEEFFCIIKPYHIIYNPLKNFIPANVYIDPPPLIFKVKGEKIAFSALL